MSIIISPVRLREIALAFHKEKFKKTDFDISPKNDAEFTITFLAERSYFFTTYESGGYSHAPGGDGRMYEGSTYYSNWLDKLSAIKRWLAFLRENIEIGDPWMIEELGNDGIHIGDERQNNFSEEDVEFIHQKLDIVLEALQDFASDFARIKDDLEYLKSSSNKVSKKDWGLMVMGNVMGWAMSNAIPKESIGDVWHIILQNLGNQHLIG